MTKIKIIGVLILIFLVTLALFSKYIATQNSNNQTFLKIINEQKAFTQEIAKNIFYISKNKNASTEQLNESIKLFINNMNNRDDKLDNIKAEGIKRETGHIVLLWNEFYLLVQNFRDKRKICNPYSTLILEKIVNEIYKKNLNLVVEFNKLIKMHKKYFNGLKERNKLIQISLFIILLVLILYLFTQLKDLILFMQKFLQTSKNIIQKSTVEGVKPIDLKPKLDAVSEASNDFNFLIKKINQSIDISIQSMQNSTNSLEQIEKRIDDLLELIATMDNDIGFNKELIKKENIMIEALEELSNTSHKLQILKKSLEKFKK